MTEILNENSQIIVNATALDGSGALSILKQFVENIPKDNHKWVIFIAPTIEINTDNKNIDFIPVKSVKSLYKRFWWDIYGLKKYIKSKNISPLACVSLQNTGFSVGKKVKSYIYYHQSIPFYPQKWNPLKKRERTFWFYKYIYPFFVKIFLKKDSTVFVQLDFIKNGFHKKFNHPRNLIEVYNPSMIRPSKSSNQRIINNSKSIIFFYPATKFFYKNHKVIQEALASSGLNTEVFFTIEEPSETDIDTRIKYLGKISYDKVCEMYETCDALLFPSYIETFGLPLLEAAMTGIPIIAADLPYAREVLNGYEGVKYVKHDDPQAWLEAMMSIEKGKRYKPIDISDRKGWSDLFKSILSKLK